MFIGTLIWWALSFRLDRVCNVLAQPLNRRKRRIRELEQHNEGLFWLREMEKILETLRVMVKTQAMGLVQKSIQLIISED